MPSPTRIYDYLALSRARILDWTRPLSPGQYTQPFAIGPGSIARTLTHIMISEWYYVQRMLRRDVPPYEQWPIRDEDPPAFAVLESTWAGQSAATRAAIGEIADWDAEICYGHTDETGRRMRITTTPADIFTQLAFHEVHHRAQVMNMLRQHGVAAADIDFNTLMYQITEDA
ncbi:MAG: DinB family protein [Phycisphaerales bacterium]|nr:DinB family protein [Phycisphaerales bacterium]